MKKSTRIWALTLVWILVLCNISAAYGSNNSFLIERKEGLTPDEMLQLATDKLENYRTYKILGEVSMDVEVSVPGQPVEAASIKIRMGGEIENPDKIYLRSTMYEVGYEDESETLEIFTDDKVVYLRASGDEKWIKQNIHSFRQDISQLVNNNPQEFVRLVKENFNVYDFRPQYLEDEEVYGRKYYVIGLVMNSETFKKIYKQQFFQGLDNSFYEAAARLGRPLTREELLRYELERMTAARVIDQFLSGTNVEIQYKYYIDQETKDFYKLESTGYITMTFNLGEMSSAYDRESNNNIHYVIVDERQIKAEYFYFGFNQKVSFPEILPSDIQR